MKAAKVTLLALFFVLATNAFAQETPEFEVAGQYSLAHFCLSGCFSKPH